VKDGSVFFLSGMDINNGYSKYCFKYTPADNKLHRVADIPLPRSAFGLVTIGNFIYVISGVTDVASCLKYNWKYDVWKEYLPLPSVLEACNAIAIQERFIYVIGGYVNT
jgi:hypothetical protein